MEWIKLNRLLRIFSKDKVKSTWLLIIFLILIYAPMTFYVKFVHNRTIAAVEKEKIDDIEQILRQSSQSVNLVLNNIEEGVFKITRNHHGISILLGGFKYFSEDFKSNFMEFIEERFEALERTMPYIDGFACISRDGEVVALDENIVLDGEKFLKSDFYNKLLSSDQQTLWHYGHLDFVGFKERDEKMLFLVYKVPYIEKIKAAPQLRDIDEIQNMDGTDNLGYFFIAISSESFKTLYKDTNIGNTGGLGIYDVDKNPVLSTVNYHVPQSILNSLVQKENFYKMNKVVISKEKYFLGVAPLSPIDWFFVAVVPKDELTTTVKRNLKSNYTPIILVSIAAALLIIIETLILSKVISEKEIANYRLVVSEKMNEKLRIYKHDFTNHLQIIWGLLELKHYDKALNYLLKASNEGRTIKEKYEVGIPEIESTIFSVLSRAREQNIEVQIDCITLKSDFPVKIYDLTKILSNLLKNAMYGLERVESNNKKLKIRIYEELGEYIFEVINNLPLIHEDMKEKIFEKGFTTKGKEGSGLGLYIVKKLTEKNRGSIELNVDEEGNHFIVRFPIEQKADNKILNI